MMEGYWSLLQSWLRPHRGISPEKLSLDLAFFQFTHNARKRGTELLEIPHFHRRIFTSPVHRMSLRYCYELVLIVERDVFV